MTKTDKIIVAFLVSMGLFSAKCAAEYVGKLSSGQKAAFINLTDGKQNTMVALNSSPQPVEDGKDN